MANTADGLTYPESDASPEADARQDAREALIYNTTEDLLVCLDRLNVTKAELARRLGKQPSAVSRALSGGQNMTLATFSDICHALGFSAVARVGGAEALLAPERRGEVDLSVESNAIVDEDATGSWTQLVRDGSESGSFRIVNEKIIECDVPQWHANAA